MSDNGSRLLATDYGEYVYVMDASFWQTVLTFCVMILCCRPYGNCNGMESKVKKGRMGLGKKGASYIGQSKRVPKRVSKRVIVFHAERDI